MLEKIIQTQKASNQIPVRISPDKELELRRLLETLWAITRTHELASYEHWLYYDIACLCHHTVRDCKQQPCRREKKEIYSYTSIYYVLQSFTRLLSIKTCTMYRSHTHNCPHYMHHRSQNERLYSKMMPNDMRPLPTSGDHCHSMTIYHTP